jgi:translocation and assembly module TamA
MTSALSPSALRLTAAAALAAALSGVHPAAAASRQSPVVLVGVADSSLRETIEAVLPVRDRPETAFDADRLSREAAERIGLWLRSEGYYGGAARPAPEGEVARVSVGLGERFTFAAPSLRFEGEEPDAVARAAAAASLSAIAIGAPARAADVLAAEAGALEALRQRGYLEAKLAPREAIVDHAAREMRVTLAIAAGPAQRMAALRLAPEGFLDEAALAPLQTWEPGARADPAAIAQVRRDLARSGLFERIDVRLAPAGGDPTAPRDVVAEVVPAKPRVLELGASWSTSEGLGAGIAWTRRNLLRRAETLRLDASASEAEQRLGAVLTVPNAAGRGRARRFEAALTGENVAPFERTGVLLATSVVAERNLAFAATYGLSLSADVYDARAGVESATVLSGFLNLRRDAADSLLDPRRGYIVEGRVEPAVSAGDASAAFARTIGEARYYYTPQDGNLTLAARGRVGWVATLSGGEDAIPLDRRFFAGGGGSVRGYPYRAIFPDGQSRLAEPPGGLGLGETSLEARYKLGPRFGLVGFVDAGAAFNQWEDAVVRYGAGVGVRYDLGFAPLRLDLATPLDRRRGEDAVAVYVSLGQAF